MPRLPRIVENSPDRWSLPTLAKEDHKYTRGHVALLGGGIMTGAAKLAALAAQRSGAGLVTLAAPKHAWTIYARGMMSVITKPVNTNAEWSRLLRTRKVSQVLLGPGCEPDRALAAAIRAATTQKLPQLLDAGALTLLAENAALRKLVHGAVLTPHEGEYKKLAAAWKLDTKASKAQRALALAKKSGCIVLLKGDETFIAAPDGRIVRNKSNAPQLATAGSGDVLSGIIAGLWAQGMDAFDAACAGAWFHSQAARRFGRGMIPEDLLAVLPEVMQQLDKKKGR